MADARNQFSDAQRVEAFVFLILLAFFVGPWRPLVIGTLPPRSACMGNLVQIERAVKQWAIDNHISGTNTYSVNDPEVLYYLRYSTLPPCPEGGVYSAGDTVADEPRCSRHGTLTGPPFPRGDYTQEAEELYQRDVTYSLITVLFVGLCGYLISPFSFLPEEHRRWLLVCVPILFASIAACLLYFWSFYFGWQAFVLALFGAAFSMRWISNAKGRQRTAVSFLFILNASLVFAAFSNLVRLDPWVMHLSVGR